MSAQDALGDVRLWARDSVRLYFEPVLWVWRFLRWYVRGVRRVLLLSGYYLSNAIVRLLSGRRSAEIDLLQLSMQDRESAAIDMVETLRDHWNQTSYLLWRQSKLEPDRERFEAAVLQWLRSEALLMTWLAYTRDLNADKPLLVSGATHLLSTLLETESQIIARLASAAASADARKEVLDMLRRYVEQREQQGRPLRELLGMEHAADDSEAWKHGAPPGWRRTPTR